MLSRLALTGFYLAAAPAAADLSDVVQLDLINGWSTQDGTHLSGLRISLAPGWKTYWRAPGDGGIPPVMSIGESENIAGHQFHWPTPEVMYQNGMRSIGYDGGVVLPLELEPMGDGPMQLTGSLQIGICDEICVPVTFSLDHQITPSERREPALVAAMLDRPMRAEDASVGDVSCEIAPISDGLELRASVTVPRLGRQEVIVVETGMDDVWVSEADTRREGAALYGMVDMVHTSGTAFALDRSAVRITVLAKGTAVEINGCPAP